MAQQRSKFAATTGRRRYRSLGRWKPRVTDYSSETVTVFGRSEAPAAKFATPGSRLLVGGKSCSVLVHKVLHAAVAKLKDLADNFWKDVRIRLRFGASHKSQQR